MQDANTARKMSYVYFLLFKKSVYGYTLLYDRVLQYFYISKKEQALNSIIPQLH